MLHSTAPLSHDHYAATERHGDFDVDVRAEVALVSRNIRVEAVDMFDADYFFRPQRINHGVRIRVLEGAEANLQDVLFVKGGFWFSPKIYDATIRLHSFGSVVRSCVFDETFANPISVRAPGAVLNRNTIVKAVMSGIRIMAPGAVVTDNLVLEAKCFPWCAGCCGKWNVFAGAYELDPGSEDAIFTGNVAGGGPIGVKINTAPPARWFNNLIHTAQIGVAVNGGCGGRAVRVQDTTIYRAWDFGEPSGLEPGTRVAASLRPSISWLLLNQRSVVQSHSMQGSGVTPQLTAPSSSLTVYASLTPKCQ